MSRSRVIITLLFALLAFIFVFSAYARADDAKNYIAAGSVTLDRNEGSFNRALSAAMNNAVLAALTDAVPENILSKNFSELAPFLLKDAGTYIQSYEILGEGNFNNTSNIVIEAAIVPQQLQNALQSAGLFAGGGSSSANVAVFVDANSVFDPEMKQWWQVHILPDALLQASNTLGNAITEHGFNYLPAVPTHARATQGIRNNAEPQDADIAVVAKAVDADVVVLGTLTFTSRQDRSVMGNYHIQATANLRVLEVATGKTLCIISKNGGAVNEDQDLGASLALMEVTKLAADELAACINTAQIQTEQTGTTNTYVGESRKIAVSVTGNERSLTDYTNFRRAVANIEGISSVNVSSMSLDGMNISFNYEGTVQMLMDHIANFNFPNFTTKVLTNGPDFINFEISSPDDLPQMEQTD